MWGKGRGGRNLKTIGAVSGSGGGGSGVPWLHFT